MKTAEKTIISNLEARLDTAEHVVVEAALPELPKLIPLPELASIPNTGDPNELLRHRFLCKGGAMLLVGQTGFGKSSFIIQAAVQWARGQAMFGIEPVRPLRSWIIQAENDPGDLVEVRDGVALGMSEEGLATQDQLRMAFGAVSVVTVDDVAGPAFPNLLNRLLENAGDAKPDLVFIDPLLAYIGGDVSKQEVASKFLREGLNPIIHRHNIGLVVVHHTSKPPREPRHEQNGDYAYLGTGSSELANWARAVLCIQSVAGSNHVYRLLAAKRGRRLGWLDNSEVALSRFIAHSRVPRRICWVTPDPADIPEEAETIKPGRKAKTTQQLADQAFELIRSSADKWMRLQSFKAVIKDHWDIGLVRQNDIINQLQEDRRLVKRKVFAGKQYDIIGLPGITDAAAKEIMDKYRNPELK